MTITDNPVQQAFTWELYLELQARDFVDPQVHEASTEELFEELRTRPGVDVDLKSKSTKDLLNELRARPRIWEKAVADGDSVFLELYGVTDILVVKDALVF